MKRFVIFCLIAGISSTIIAQSVSDSWRNRLFKQLVLDIGATPFSTASSNQSLYGTTEFSSYNFSLGYRVYKNLDIRVNTDINNFLMKVGNNGLNHYDFQRLIALSLGTNFVFFNGGENTFLDGLRSGVNGKFGVTIDPEYKEQESLFYDLSLRTYFGKVPYIGLGFNHQINGMSYLEDLKSFYISFGIDF